MNSNTPQPHWMVPVVVGLLLALGVTWLGLNDWRVFGGSEQAGSAPSTAPDAQGVPPIRSITLPQDVFAFSRVDHESRQSHTLQPDEVGEGAYAYAYWEDPDSIWMDATAGGGEQAVAAVKGLRDAAEVAGQGTTRSGNITCVWHQDADPGTPRHGVSCYVLSDIPALAMIVDTHTATVGEVSPSNLTAQVWRAITTG